MLMAAEHGRATIRAMPTSSTISPLRIVIAGGGVGALEALMALHDLGEQRFELTLVAPDDDFVLRPMSVAVPFSAGHVTHVPLVDICTHFGAARVRSPMGRGLLAFAPQANVTDAARTFQGTPMSWTQVLATIQREAASPIDGEDGGHRDASTP